MVPTSCQLELALLSYVLCNVTVSILRNVFFVLSYIMYVRFSQIGSQLSVNFVNFSVTSAQLHNETNPN